MTDQIHQTITYQENAAEFITSEVKAARENTMAILKEPETLNDFRMELEIEKGIRVEFTARELEVLADLLSTIRIGFSVGLREFGITNVGAKCFILPDIPGLVTIYSIEEDNAKNGEKVILIGAQQLRKSLGVYGMTYNLKSEKPHEWNIGLIEESTYSRPKEFEAFFIKGIEMAIEYLKAQGESQLLQSKSLGQIKFDVFLKVFPDLDQERYKNRFRVNDQDEAVQTRDVWARIKRVTKR